MVLKAFIILLTLHVHLQLIAAQSGAPYCNYMIYGSYYACDLKLNNTNGLTNFTDINGTHLSGKTDDDVEGIYNQYASTALSTSVIPTIICEKFKNLKTFYPSTGGIQIVDENALKSCKNLEVIQFYENKINYVHVDAFKEHSNLTYLGFSYNLLTSLPEDVFINLVNLKTLYLNWNRFNDFPKSIFRSLRKLDILSLAGNSIFTPRPEWFLSLENLRVIYLNYNKIQELPANLFTPLKNITYIYLSDNQLSVLHAKSFGTLPSLTYLIVSQNKISAIDERILDNTAVFLWEIQKNVCLDESMVFDYDLARTDMRRTMKKCFDNYNVLVPGCLIGNLDVRVCKLESANEDWQENFNYLYLQIAQIKDENIKIPPIIYDIQKFIDRQKMLEMKIDAIARSVQRLLEKVFPDDIYA